MLRYFSFYNPIKKILYKKLFSPIDIFSLIFIRICFGLIMLWEVTRYFKHEWISAYYIKPIFHFKYYGFSWIQPWANNGMYLHFYIMGALAILITIGLFYRFATILFFLSFTYIFLLDEAQYLNHFYLISLLSFLLIFIPANSCFSFDCYRKPQIYSQNAPYIALWLVRFQVAIPYIYGGIAKINSDWLNGEPMRDWLSSRSQYLFIGPYVREEWFVYLFSYGGIIFDLLVVPLLICKKTRDVAFIFAVLFHLTNAWIFSIGIFPWMMIALTTIFFEPSWIKLSKVNTNKSLYKIPSSSYQKLATILFSIYITLQVLFPFRHYLYPGIVHWTEEGHRFSWHMKLRSKNGSVRFLLIDQKTYDMKFIYPQDFLTKRQARKMSYQPDMILQFAHAIPTLYKIPQDHKVAIYADSKASLNSRPYQRLIDPNINLLNVNRSIKHSPWIIPLQENNK